MPYIQPELRKCFRSGLILLMEDLTNVGQCGGQEKLPACLNYIISTLARHCVGDKYATKNAVIGVLECAKLELYRTDVGPYEERKRGENGDVPTLRDLKGTLGTKER